MVMLNPSEHDQGQLQRHAASHLPNGADPIAQVTTTDIKDGQVIVYVNGTPVVMDVQNVINNYTTGIGVGTVYISFGSEAVTGQAYAP